MRCIPRLRLGTSKLSSLSRRVCLFPGSAWEHTASEAPPRKAGGACKARRSQAEPGNEVLLAFAGVMIKALAGPRTITQLSAAAARHPGWGRGDFPKF